MYIRVYQIDRYYSEIINSLNNLNIVTASGDLLFHNFISEKITPISYSVVKYLSIYENESYKIFYKENNKEKIKNSKEIREILSLVENNSSKKYIISVEFPENNNTPILQLKTLELLCWLSKYIKVVIFTYSPYILLHLSNLVIPKTIKDEKKFKKINKSVLYANQKCFIKYEDVEVYNQSNGCLVSRKTPEDENFLFRFDDILDISGDIQSKFFLIHKNIDLYKIK